MRIILLVLASWWLVAAAPPPAVPPSAAPKEAPLATPALWKISDADTTIYLFGTVHVLPKDTRWFEGPLRAAFDGSDELVLEMLEPAPPEAGQIVMRYAVDPDGPPLSEKLSPQARASYQEAIQRLGLNVANMDRLEPWFVSTLIPMVTMMHLGLDPKSGAEAVLTEAAKKGGKSLGALETMEQQMGFFDTLPEAEQIAMLSQSVEELPNMPRLTQDMLSAWRRGEPDRLAELMTDDIKNFPEVERVLFTERNRRWADWIVQRMARPGTVFLAVGAGHLAGKGSVQSLLSPHQLTAIRIR